MTESWRTNRSVWVGECRSLSLGPGCDGGELTMFPRQSTNPAGWPLRLTVCCLILTAIFLVISVDGRANATDEPGSPTGECIPFIALLQGELTTGAQAGPLLLFAADASEARTLIRWPNSRKAAEWIDTVDYQQWFVAAVFAGAKGRSGYRVNVNEIRATPEKVCIIVALTEPAGPSSEVISYPYQVLKISRSACGLGHQKLWEVWDTTGKLLIQKRFAMNSNELLQ